MKVIDMMFYLIGNYFIYILVYLICADIVSFILFSVDKKLAVHRAYRISEATLLFFAFIGGGVGALLAMLIKRHKTRHLSFMIFVPLCAAAQLCLITAGFLQLLQYAG